MIELSWEQDWIDVDGGVIIEANYKKFALEIDGSQNIDLNLPFKANGVYSYKIDPLTIPLNMGNHTAKIRVVLKDGQKSEWAKVQFTLSSIPPKAPKNLTAT